MATPDLSLLSSQFVEFGGPIFGKHVVDWDLKSTGVQVRTNVNAPQALVKISALGGPKPYATADETSGNGAKMTDQILTAYQSKWDYDFDPEQFRNTYLANADGSPFYQQAISQVAREYLAAIVNNTLGSGVRNGSGTSAADLCNGWLTEIATLISGSVITPITTGAITSSNAVTKIDTMKVALPTWLKQYGAIFYCSYSVFENYAAHYRTLNGFKFEPRITGDYPIDNTKHVLRPVSWLGSSSRVIATIANNLVFGTDIERVQLYATPYRNIIKVRQMMPVGCAIQDTEALFVNDQA